MAFDIAGSQILAQPVSGFLQGRAVRRAEQESDARMKATDMAEGRAQAQEHRESEAFSIKKKEYDDATKASNTQALHGVLSQIETSDDPIGTATTLFRSPKIAALFHDKDPLEALTGKTPEQVKAAAAEGRMQLDPFVKKPAAQSKEGKVAADVKSGLLTKKQGDAAIAGDDKPPNSFLEFTLSEKDPKYAAFLEKNRGKGIRINPDGTIEIGGAAGGVGPAELTKPTINNLQESIVNSSNRLDRLNSLLGTYKPEFLQAKGLVQAGTSELKDFLGVELTKDQRDFLSGYSEFKANSSQEFSATLKELSGTAASDKEVARVIKGVPSDQDKSPVVFEAKARATTKFITRAIMRANWAVKNGIGVKSVDELAKVMPLEGIDQVYELKANEIWQELGGTPETKNDAVKRANQEFGLAR